MAQSAKINSDAVSEKVSSVTWVMLITMVVLWGISWPAMKIALDYIQPLWLGAIRFLSGSLSLFLFLACRRTLRIPTKHDLPIVFSVGGLQMLAFTALGLIAMQHTDASRAALLAYTTPLWGVILSWLMFRQVPGRVQGAALLIGLAGIALVCSPSEMDWSKTSVVVGCLLLTLAAGCWSVVILHVRRHRWHHTPLQLAPWQMLFAAIPMAILALIAEGTPADLPDSPRIWMLLLFIGPVATSVCFVISTSCGRRVSSFTLSNFTLGVPVTGSIASVLLLGTTLSMRFGMGLALIILGSVIAIYSSNTLK